MSLICSRTHAMVEQYAAFWKRVIATFIDWILVSMITGFISWIITGEFAGDETFRKINTLFFFQVYGVYSILMESSRLGATVGKLILKIKIVTIENKQLSVPQAFFRYFARLFSFFTAGFGCVMALFTLKRQGLHDQITKTLVINKA